MSNQVYIPPINFNENENNNSSIVSINAVDPLEYNKLNSKLSIKAATENNFRPYDKIMIDRINEFGLKIKFYPGRIQFKNSNLCGYFSIMIAKYLKKYEPDNPFNLINELFGLKADNNDIKQLIKHFGTLKTDD